MKNLSRRDRNGVRTAVDLERRYRFNDIDYTKEEIQKLKMQIITDDHLSATSTNPVQNKVVTNALNNKVNKEAGKGLSTNDFTDELLDKLNNMESTGGGGDTLPIGAVIEWDNDTIPENWLLLDGQAVSRTEYSELFALYGTRYGAGNGSTTFNLPNRKTRVSVGKDSTDSDFNTLGKTGGEKTHKLEVYEIPSHRHNLANANENGADLTFTPVLLGNMNKGWEGSAFTSYEGGGAAHNNLQPYFVTNFIVKAKHENITSENVEEVTRQILLDVYPVGSIYMSVSPTNPSTLFGGKWEAWGTGRVPVGVDTAQTEFATVEKTGGDKLLQRHTHSAISSNGKVSGMMRVVGNVGTGNAANHITGYSSGDYKDLGASSEDWNGASHYHDITVTPEGQGESQNLQPYITCYMWKRTA